MAPQDILKKIKAQPFRPIRIHVSDGTACDIVEPTHAFLVMTECTVGLEPDACGIPKKSIYIAPDHVTRIEPIDVASRAE